MQYLLVDTYADTQELKEYNELKESKRDLNIKVNSDKYLIEENKRLENVIWELKSSNSYKRCESLKAKLMKMQNDLANSEASNSLLREENDNLRKTNMKLREESKRNSQENKPQIKTIPMTKINMHGFSVNEMYEANPYYNPTKTGSHKLKRTNKYNEWTIKLLNEMKISHLKSLKEMNINPNNKMKIELCFGTKAGYDADNLAKSFIDTLVKHYNLPHDNNFFEISIKKEIVNNKKDGYIKYAFYNI
jgi:Holliday junction resolvase RusA-like endonuclease